MSTIAKAAGVGKATVSLALRNDPRLRPETCRRIQKIAADMGYRANPVVSNLMAQLRASKTPKFQATLGLVNAAEDRSMLREVDTFRHWVDGLMRGSAELGYRVDEFWLHEKGVSPARLLQILESRNIRGLIIAGILSHGQLAPKWDPIWQKCACVSVGLRPSRPTLHVASNDQFTTALRMVGELTRRGYSRPGLVIRSDVDENLDWRFSAGFWSGQNALLQKQRIPQFPFLPGEREPFRRWLEKHKPDAIACLHKEVKDWLTHLGLRIPQDIGLAHLDRTADLHGWSGMNQNNELVGAAAVDLVIGQLHRNESGIPDHPKCVMIESSWVDGGTLKM